LPRRLQPRAKAALHEVMHAETREQAREAITRFATEYGPKYPKAVTTLEKDADTLLTFFDFPAEHWKHLRTSNVIESPFATVRLRQRVTKGAGSRTKGLLMAYKLLDMAQARWRRLNGAQLLPLVRAGVLFADGVQQQGRATKTGAKAARVPRTLPAARHRGDKYVTFSARMNSDADSFHGAIALGIMPHARSPSCCVRCRPSRSLADRTTRMRRR